MELGLDFDRNLRSETVLACCVFGRDCCDTYIILRKLLGYDGLLFNH